MACVALLVGCDRPHPVTTYLATNEFAEDDRAKLCSDRSSHGIAEYGSLPKEYRWFQRASCRLNLTGDTNDTHGNVPLELQGGVGTLYGVCAVRIGPAPVDGYVSPSVIENFVQDGTLRKQIDDVLKTIDETKEYSMQATVGGFQIDVQQDISGIDGPMINLRIDGCGQFKPDLPARRTQGNPVPEHKKKFVPVPCRDPRICR